MTPLKIAITPGEPAGVGPDLVIELAQQEWPAQLVIFADETMMQELTDLGIEGASLIAKADEVSFASANLTKVVDVLMEMEPHLELLERRGIDVVDAELAGGAQGDLGLHIQVLKATGQLALPLFELTVNLLLVNHRRVLLGKLRQQAVLGTALHIVGKGIDGEADRLDSIAATPQMAEYSLLQVGDGLANQGAAHFFFAAREVMVHGPERRPGSLDNRFHARGGVPAGPEQICSGADEAVTCRGLCHASTLPPVERSLQFG